MRFAFRCSDGRPSRRAGGPLRGAIVDRVMRRPLVSLVLAGGLLLALAAPVLGLDTGTSGAATLPDRFESKQWLPAPRGA